MPQLTLHAEDDGGTELAAVDARTVEKSEELAGEMDHAEVVLSRDAWDTLDDALDRVNDHLVVTTDHPDLADPFFAGRFDDDERGDTSATVHIVSYERDAQDAQPTGDNVAYQNVDDSEIVEDLVNAVPTLSMGTVDTLAENLSMSFSYATPSKALRDVEEATGGELRYNADRTVDYVAHRGADKPGVVLSPVEQTVLDDLSVEEDARETVTHVRGFGAQSGPDQVTAEAVADSYQEGDRQIWREYENKDVIEESRLQSIVDRLVEEYDGEPRQIDVETSVPVSLGADVGDRVQVEVPGRGVDRMLRVVQRRASLGPAGALVGVTLSNRLTTRGNRSRSEERKTLQEFRRGHQGFVDRSQITSGWDAAGDGNAHELIVVNWPDDIVSERVVKLAVHGRAWRSPVTPESHRHSVSIGSHRHDVTYSVPFHTHDIDTYSVGARTSTEEGHDHEYDRASHTAGPSDAETNTETSESGGATTTTSGSTVGLSPEITDTFDGDQYYPSDVEIRVNGSTVATLGGDDSSGWLETVDLSGELAPGQNTIEADPSTRGQLNLILASELFRRGRSDT